MKNTSSLSISARYIKNEKLTSTMWNIIDPIGVSKIINLIDDLLLIPKVKLADLAILLASWIKVLSCYNIINWVMPPIDQVEVLKLISNLLNSVSFYYKLINELKI